jgi:signal transduction histidine kinase
MSFVDMSVKSLNINRSLGNLFGAEYAVGDQLRSLSYNLEDLLNLQSEEHIRSDEYLWSSGFTIDEDDAIEREITRFRIIQENLKKVEGIYYYARRGDIVFSNSGYTTAEEFGNFAHNYAIARYDGIYTAYDDEFYAQKNAAFQREKYEMERSVTALLQTLLFLLLLTIYLIAVSGRNIADELKMRKFDALWTDCNVLLIFMCMIVEIGLFSVVVVLQNSSLNSDMVLLSGLLFAFGLTLVLSLSRHFKNRTLFTHSFCGMIIVLLIKWGRKIFNIEVLEDTRAKLELTHKNQIKAERMKAELITNVSHDLKTPLTAIINYADLLQKQDKKNEYAKIIYDKSLKLKELTEKLFEVSRAQSGNLKVEKQRVDLRELISQTLAEHQGKFKVNVPEIFIETDGQLMAGVFDNLISNMVKYSMEGTNLYIDAEQRKNGAIITFRNIADYEMNFKGDEVTERFIRGTGAREGEGNGLGLAIAKSYTEACGGTLNIKTDGDLFKVEVEL